MPLLAVSIDCFCNVEVQQWKESDFLGSGQIASDDLSARTHTHTHTHTDKCKISIMIGNHMNSNAIWEIIALSHALEGAMHLKKKIHEVKFSLQIHGKCNYFPNCTLFM